MKFAQNNHPTRLFGTWEYVHLFFHFAAMYLIGLIGIFKFFDQMKFLENSAAVCSADKIPLAKTAYGAILLFLEKNDNNLP